ncbi:putative ribosome-binding factor A, mitochondrial [Mantella aurantiaca]
MSGVIFNRMVVWWEIPCCVRVLSHRSRVLGFPAAAISHGRSVHTSLGLSAKNYLHKFSSKHKKRQWHYSTPHLPTENKSPGLLAMMKQKQAEKRGSNVRTNTLNGILYDALTSLLSTSEVSEEVYDLCIELSKVSVSSDFSVCRAYWLSSGNKDTDDEIEKLLQRYAPHFRHLMISYRVLGKVPTVVFVRDKEDVKRREVEDLFALLELEEKKVSSDKTEVSRKLDTEASTFQMPSIFGIDHVELNQQILAFKKKMKCKVTETDSNEHSKRQQEQLAAIKKQNLQRKKLKKQKESAYDISPQDYQLISAMDSDIQKELDFEPYEDLVELEDELEEEPDGGNTEK